MQVQFDEIDLKAKLGDPSYIKSQTDLVIGQLMNNIDILSNAKYENKNFFGCNVTLGDLDFELNLDFFRNRTYNNNYVLLEKIKFLRRLIININNIFIKIISDLNCCTTDDKYNKTVIPIFKWLVEDENGLCGTLLTISKEIYNIYIPIKRIMCLFRNIPGNPTLSYGGTDYLKGMYPIIEGLDKLANVLDNGAFLDILIIPVKNFHDKLVSCSSGDYIKFYDKKVNLLESISKGLYEELTTALIDEIKSTETMNEIEKTRPTEPTPPKYDFKAPPKPSKYNNMALFRKAMVTYNIEFMEYKKEMDREYEEALAVYRKDFEEYKNKKFQSTFTLGENNFENTNLALDVNVERMKDQHKPICGCLGELFRLDGFFFPAKHIIRDEGDLLALVGHVEYRGINSENYYEDQSIDGLNGKRRLKIIREQDLGEIRNKRPEKSMEIVIKGSFLDNEYNNLINSAQSVQDVINNNNFFANEKNTKVRRLQVLKSETNGLYDAFNNLHKSYLQKGYRTIANNRVGLANIGNLDTTGSNFSNSSSRYIEEIKRAQRELQELSQFPPLAWIQNPNDIRVTYGADVRTFNDYMEAIKEIEKIDKEVIQLDMALEKNHTYINIVDNSYIPCSCDLLCMIIKYIIGVIMDVIKKLIAYIVDFLAKSIMNKELQWWLEFIISKIQCILDIINIPAEIESMEAKFNQEMKSAKDSIKLMSQYLDGCKVTESVINNANLNKKKLPITPDTLPDITWDPTTYPTFEQENNDMTPIIPDGFKIIAKDISYENSSWKNRTIPVVVLDCTKDHLFQVDFTPKGFNWSAYLNVTINYEQFQNNPNLVLNGNQSITEEGLIKNTYTSIIWNLINALYSSPETFTFRIVIGNNGTDLRTDSSFLEDERINVGGNYFDINDIDKVYIWYDKDKGYVKVFDRTMSKNLEEFYVEHLKNSEKIKEEIMNTEFDIEEAADDSATKLCTVNGMKINSLDLLYKDKTTSLYAGTVTKREAYDEKYNLIEYFTYTPSTHEDEPLIRPNVPFLLELENGAGYVLKIILLIDVCYPEAVENTRYDKSRDGVFLNGRYDYFEFDSIPNNLPITWNRHDIFKKLKPYLEHIGLISGSSLGYLANNNKKDTTGAIQNEDHSGPNLEGFEKELLEQTGDFKVLESGLLPAGDIKNAISTSQEKVKELQNIVVNLDEFVSNSMVEMKNILENNSLNIDDGTISIIEDSVNISKKDSHLGIPLMVLNEEENIILTIQDKKLKLININRNFGATEPDLIIDEEIDYKKGEQLLIEFKTNGFSHTISWLNARKVKATKTTTVFNSLSLKPTNIGSVYKEGKPIALMCGKLNDLIISEDTVPMEEWWTNTNTYRPDGTIGYYDFTLFDGYHVYSLPPNFRVTTIEKLATVKGILYETEKYTQAEINSMIQNGKYNDLLKTQVTVVGERPISVGGDFIWKNKTYYKNVTFGYLDNFFCRDNLLGKPFTISFWLKQKDAASYGREEPQKKYIFSDINNGNFIWYEDEILYIKLFGNTLRSEPVTMLFKKDVMATKPEFVEKWYHHTFRYDRINAKVYYTIECINQNRNFDINYSEFVLEKKEVLINLKNIEGRGKVLDFSLVSMLARYDVKKLKYVDQFPGEIAALAIWNEFKSNEYLNEIRDYQKIIIQNEMED